MISRLVFLGDVSVDRPYSHPLCASRGLFEGVDCVIANLEGPILDQKQLSSLRQRVPFPVHNTVDAVDVLAQFRVRATSCANNHMYDFDVPFEGTAGLLKGKGIGAFGAGRGFEEAARPLDLTVNGRQIKVFAFGWKVIGCRLARNGNEGINPLAPRHLFDTISVLRRHDQTSFVVFLFHWNFELALYPLPGHRKLAHDLIRRGVDAVIGCHCHVAGGAEQVEGKPIVYGLGNWFSPERKVKHLTLSYPATARRELAVEIALTERKIAGVKFHWHNFDPVGNIIRYEAEEDWNGPILRRLTPYSGFSHAAYVNWFKRHRTRRRGLPVYKEYASATRVFNDLLVKMRQKVIELLVRLHLKGGPRL